MKKTFTILFTIMTLSSLLPLALASVPGNQAPVTIYLVQKANKKAEKLVLDMWDAQHYGLNHLSNHQRLEVDPVEPHILLGLMPAEEIGFRLRSSSISATSLLNISLDGYPVIQNYFTSPGDSVMISINERAGMTTFTGPSAPKFRLQFEMKSLLSEALQAEDITLPFSSAEQFESFIQAPKNKEVYASLDDLFGRKSRPVQAGSDELEYLKSLELQAWIDRIDNKADSYSNIVDPESLWLIRSSAISSLYQIYLSRLSAGYTRAVGMDDPGLQESFEAFLDQELNHLPMDMILNSVQNSPASRSLLIALTQLDVDRNQSDFWVEVFRKFPDPVSERIAVQYLSDYRRKLSDFESLALSLKSKVASTSLKNELDAMLGRYGKGVELYSFDFIGTDGRKVDQSEFLGKTIVMDFWITGCGACKSFHKNVLDPVISQYQSSDEIIFLSVCADLRPDYWEKRTKQDNPGDVSGPIEVYATRQSGSNPFLDHYNIRTYPQLMIISTEGTLQKLGSAPRTVDELESEISRTLPY